MNAPETIPAPINPAHEVLLKSDNAMCVDEVARAIVGKKPTKADIKSAAKLLKEIADLGLIEMEPRAGGVPFYRLIVAGDQTMSESHETRAIAGAEGGDQIESTEPKADMGNPITESAPEAIDAPSPHSADNDFSLLGVIADIRAAIGDTGQIMLGDLAAQIGEIAQERSRLQAENLALKTLNDAMPGFGAEHQEQRIDSLTKDVINTRTALTNALNEANRLRGELAAERQAREAMQEQSDAVDVKDAAVGYLIRVTKRKPRYVTKPERARDAALAAVRAGAGRAEVLAVVPVGVARRGAEWRGIAPQTKGD